MLNPALKIAQMKSRFLILILSLLIVHFSFSQDTTWLRIFGYEESMAAKNLIESYDKGIVIGGHTKPASGQSGFEKEGLIIKTDINGNELWRKIIGKPDDNGTGSIVVKQTNDGGYVLYGGTYKFGNRNIFLMKLNACGEKEWNKIFISEFQSQYNVDLEIMNDSNYLIQISYWGQDIVNQRIWLFKISQEGDIIWNKVFANWNPSPNNEEGRHLAKFEDTYLITGDYFEYQPGYDTNLRYSRPMYIKLDNYGEEIWHTLWGIEEFYVGWQAKSTFNSNGYIYSVGKNETIELIDDMPVMQKLSPDGDQLYYKNIEELSKAGGATTISLLSDSILYIGATWMDHQDGLHNVIYKTDTLGNIISQNEVLQEGNSFNESILTYDNKLVVVGSFYTNSSWKIYLFKFNQDLDYDSIYSQSFIYDSLCPYQIVPDTISLDTTTVNLEELYATLYDVKIYPNPANSSITIDIGDELELARLDFITSTGVVAKTVKLDIKQRHIELDIHLLSKGVYLIRCHNTDGSSFVKKLIIR